MQSNPSCPAQGVVRSTDVVFLAGRMFRKTIPLVAEWRRRYRYRADLRRLLKIGPYMIEDIGLAYDEALRESRKTIWRP